MSVWGLAFFVEVKGEKLSLEKSCLGPLIYAPIFWKSWWPLNFIGSFWLIVVPLISSFSCQQLDQIVLIFLTCEEKLWRRQKKKGVQQSAKLGEKQSAGLMCVACPGWLCLPGLQICAHILVIPFGGAAVVLAQIKSLYGFNSRQSWQWWAVA